MMATMTKQAQKDDLISVDEAVEDHGLSRATIYRKIGGGQLKSYRRLGDKRTLISRAALKKLMAVKERE